MVSAGTFVTVTLAGEAAGVLTADRLQSLASSTLQAAGFQVGNIVVDAGTTFDNVVGLRWFHYLYSATVILRARDTDYGTPEDIAAIVANAFYQATGFLPQGQQAVVTDGAFETTAPGSAPSAALLQTASDAISALWQGAKDTAAGAQTDTQLVIVGVVLLAGVLAYLVFEGKNTGSLAKLVRA